MAEKKLKESSEGRSPLAEEFDQWMYQQTRGQLKNLYNVFEKHRDYLNKNALNFIGANKTDEARMSRAKAEDMNKLIGLINERIRECAKETNK